nr:MAG TPA: hypothetical protein [Caudoviricetes sp.]
MPLLYKSHLPEREGGDFYIMRKTAGDRRELHHADMLFRQEGLRCAHGRILQGLFLCPVSAI